MTYDDLKADVIRHIKRPPLIPEAGNFIARAEDGLNRKLPAVEADASLVAVPGSRNVDLSSLAITRPIALFLTDGSAETELTPVPDMALSDDTGRPVAYGTSRAAITFNRPADAPYPLRFRYLQRFALSDAVPTNWLLENHYDAYLAAALVWAYARQEDLQNASQWEQKLASTLRDIKTEIASFKASELRVDPALQRIGRRQGVR